MHTRQQHLGTTGRGDVANVDHVPPAEAADDLGDPGLRLPVVAADEQRMVTAADGFPSKEDPIAAYLERSNERFRAWLEGQMAEEPGLEQAERSGQCGPHCIQCNQ
jgi:hypothetical protein